MKLAGHVARMGEARNIYKMLVEKPEHKRHFGVLGVDERIILKLFLENELVTMWMGFIWLGIG
jgi:hypothetical protein